MVNDVGESVAMGLEITRELAYLHHQGVLHRDLNAENILLDKHRCAKISDLGIASGCVVAR